MEHISAQPLRAINHVNSRGTVATFAANGKPLPVLGRFHDKASVDSPARMRHVAFNVNSSVMQHAGKLVFLTCSFASIVTIVIKVRNTELTENIFCNTLSFGEQPFNTTH